ncbi:MAG: hypothetical protein M5U34_11505 [Chloroflexi bacterium]|nr:hypothetical protein [Chloroflexota bacterium]
MVAGANYDGAKMDDIAFTTANNLFIQHGGAHIPVNGTRIFNAMVLNAVFADKWTKSLHGVYLLFYDVLVNYLRCLQRRLEMLFMLVSSHATSQ